MANSDIISILKKKVVSDIINDDDIVKAIDSPDMDKDGWEPIYLVDSLETLEMGFTPHIFVENQNPNIITSAITFITIQVNIPKIIDDSTPFVYPELTIYIISHNKHRRTDKIIGINESLNDYISRLIDRKINNKKTGYGKKVRLISNIEGIYDDNFVFRQMIFRGIDINSSLCGD